MKREKIENQTAYSTLDKIGRNFLKITEHPYASQVSDSVV